MLMPFKVVARPSKVDGQPSVQALQALSAEQECCTGPQPEKPPMEPSSGGLCGSLPTSLSGSVWSLKSPGASKRYPHEATRGPSVAHGHRQQQLDCSSPTQPSCLYARWGQSAGVGCNDGEADDSDEDESQADKAEQPDEEMEACPSESSIPQRLLRMLSIHDGPQQESGARNLLTWLSIVACTCVLQAAGTGSAAHML